LFIAQIILIVEPIWQIALTFYEGLFSHID